VKEGGGEINKAFWSISRSWKFDGVGCYIMRLDFLLFEHECAIDLKHSLFVKMRGLSLNPFENFDLN